MNREIKFRVWDKEKKEFTKSPIILADNGVFIDSEDYAVQQFTGLKDKNGKEIYEGDITTFQNSLGEWIMKVIEIRLGASWWGKNHRLYATYANKHEIIGNIYENPSLIKENYD